MLTQLMLDGVCQWRGSREPEAARKVTTHRTRTSEFTHVLHQTSSMGFLLSGFPSRNSSCPNSLSSGHLVIVAA